MRTDGHVATVLAALSPYDIVGTEPAAAFDIFPELACAAFADRLRWLFDDAIVNLRRSD